MVKYLITKANLKLGTRFWYSVTTIYWVKGKRVFDFQRRIGIPEKSLILDHRNIVSTFHRDIYNKCTKKLLNNGYLSYNVDCYLGWFKQNEPKGD